MPTVTRVPPFDTAFDNAASWGGAFAKATATKADGAMNIFLDSAPRTVSSAHGYTRIGILEIGPPTKPAMLSVEAILWVFWWWRLDAILSHATTKAEAWLEVSTPGGGVIAKSPREVFFDKASSFGFSVVRDSEAQNGQHVFSVPPFPIDTSHSYIAEVIITGNISAAGWKGVSWVSSGLSGPIVNTQNVIGSNALCDVSAELIQISYSY